MPPYLYLYAALEMSCRECGAETIKLLEEIQSEPNLSNNQGVTKRLEKILHCAKVISILIDLIVKTLLVWGLFRS